ncbi:hypothetical protein HID58_065169 [Brassica napus]|uniref:Uncharacterized protein n=1 Tax=Brassica napus TaxID=3708 RepID=A0ABQ7ZC07_BRANA|nr:hypothetical protein HID58_065169 [Brassica napus]
MRWERVRQQQVGLGESSCYGGPGKRWGHTCNAIKGGSFLYVFGGYGKDNCQTNQVHVFDSAKQIWTQPIISGTPPPPRDSHTCTTVGDNLLVFGGTDGTKPLNDLYILDTSSHSWKCQSVRGEGPEAREGHSATLVGKRLFVFGGCGKSSDINDEIYYNDLYVLNTETYVWKRAVTIGNPPSARDSHTCSSWKNKIVVIGGEDGHDYYLSDVHILDTDTFVWKELSTSGQLLTPRAGHVTVSLGRNLYVFGGFTDAQNLYDDLYVLDVGLGYDARLDQSVGSMSLKKQLKLKCQEQSHANPLYDNSLVRNNMEHQGRGNFGLNTGQFDQVKMMFHARVTETFPVGYSIETMIDGKLLRGVLFSTNRRNSLSLLYRKRPAMSNGDQANTSKIPRTLSKDQTVATEVKDPPSNGVEGGIGLINPLDVNINTAAVAPQLDMGTVNAVNPSSVAQTDEASLESRNAVSIDVEATKTGPGET